MNKIIVVCLLLFAIPAYGQVQLQVDSSYVHDGALVMRFMLVNQSDKTVALSVDKRRSLTQLNAAHLAQMLRTNQPQHAIVFYKKNKLVDEEPVSCDHQQWQPETITLQPQQSYALVVETHCLSESVLTTLNQGKPLFCEMYLLYEALGVINRVQTPRFKLKVQKPAF